jgi:hypothetical protein
LGVAQKFLAPALKTFVWLESENIANFAFTPHNNVRLSLNVTRLAVGFFS